MGDRVTKEYRVWCRTLLDDTEDTGPDVMFDTYEYILDECDALEAERDALLTLFNQLGLCSKCGRARGMCSCPKVWP